MYYCGNHARTSHENEHKTHRIKEKKVTTDVLKKHKVNHVALVIDKSGSMDKHRSTVIRVVDEFVKGLKEESDILGHETRISLYAFNHNVECLVWDMDVKALPSIRGLYHPDGATSLIEASVLSLSDLKTEISEKYGEHSFLQVVWTDGEENASGYAKWGNMHTQYGRVTNRRQLDEQIGQIRSVMGALPAHWTSAILVPSSLAKRTAQSYGFAAGNIAVWDAETTKGVEEAIGTVKAAATSFLRGREAGVRGTTSLFSVGQNLDVQTVREALKPLDGTKYRLLEIKAEDQDKEIRPFVEQHNITYRTGMAYYQLGNRVTVQASKNVAVLDTTGPGDGLVYTGPDALRLVFGDENVGPDGRLTHALSVKAGHNPNLRIFVQSKSVNRKLKRIPGEKKTNLLIML
jgi:hypothetical protein